MKSSYKELLLFVFALKTVWRFVSLYRSLFHKYCSIMWNYDTYRTSTGSESHAIIGESETRGVWSWSMRLSAVKLCMDLQRKRENYVFNTASGTVYGFAVINRPLTRTGMTRSTKKLNAFSLFHVMHMVCESKNVVQIWWRLRVWKHASGKWTDAESNFFTDVYRISVSTLQRMKKRCH